MGLNRFTYASQQPVLDTYAQLPFSDLLEAGLQVQKRADDDRSKLGALGQAVKANPFHAPAASLYAQSFNQRASELVKSGKKPGTPEFTYGVQDLINEYSSNPNIDLFRRGIEAYKQQAEHEADIKKSGKWRPWNSKLEHEQQALQQGVNPYFNEQTGEVGEYLFEPTPAAPDISNEASTFAQQWSSDVFPTRLKEAGYGHLSSDKIEEVKFDEVKDATRKWILSNPAYQQEFANFKTYYDAAGTDGLSMLDKYVEDIAKSIATREAFKKQTRDIRQDYQAAQDAKDAAKYATPTRQATQIGANIDLGDFPKINFKNGKAVINNNASSRGFMTSPTGWDKASIMSGDIKQPPSEEQANQFIATLKNFYPNLASLSDEAVYETVKNSRDHYKQHVLTDYNPTEEFKTALKTELIGEGFGSILQRPVQLLTTKGSGPSTLGTDLLKSLGYPDDPEKAAALLKKTTDIKIQPFGGEQGPGAYVVNIPNPKEGGTARILVTPDEEQQLAFSQSQDVYTMMNEAVKNNSGITQTKQAYVQTEAGWEVHDIQYQVIPRIEDKKFKFSIVLQDVTTGQTETYDDPAQIVKQDLEEFMNSRLLRSNLTTENRKKTAR